MHVLGVILSLALVGFSSAVVKHELHKICVPTTAIEPCKHMVQQAKDVGMILECVPARDRIDCIQKVKDHIADFQAVEPEDMYIASQIADKAFKVFMEIRTRVEPEAEFRYEAVAVVHKDLDINNIRALKGLKSCHTGVGRNVGYKIPITKLTKMGILGPLSDTALSPRENELKALSNFFSKACLVGAWSPHPDTNSRLKKTYSNLCELCENPQKCDYPDENSGYEGALRCLANGGDVAWTKVIYVKKFFGMPYADQPASPSHYNPDDFAFLCPDGTKRPITEVPCTWAARPWPGYISSNHATDEEIAEIREEVIKLNNLGNSIHADWIAKVLILNNKTIAVNNNALSPQQYLEKAKYKDVIERDVLEPRRVVRLCVETDIEMKKCELFKSAAYSRDIRPSLSCVKSEDCVQAVSKREAEVVVLDPRQAMRAESEHLKPLISEQYNGETKQDIVAIVKKGSSLGSFTDMKGTRACLHPSGSSGFLGVVSFLLSTGLISKPECPLEKSLPEVFSSTVQSSNPIQCLEEGNGDVAFVPLSSLNPKNKDNYEILCNTGGGGPIDKDCDVFTIPPKILMASEHLSDVQIDEVRQSFLSAGQLYGSQPNLFRLFGDFNGVANVIFSNHATGLEAVTNALPSYETFKKEIFDLPSCA